MYAARIGGAAVFFFLGGGGRREERKVVVKPYNRYYFSFFNPHKCPQMVGSSCSEEYHIFEFNFCHSFDVIYWNF